MKYSDIKKFRCCNKDVRCSGIRKCYDCRMYLKSNKRMNNKGIRRLNKNLCSNNLELDFN